MAILQKYANFYSDDDEKNEFYQFIDKSLYLSLSSICRSGAF